jgi:hypothetical protein
VSKQQGLEFFHTTFYDVDGDNHDVFWQWTQPFSTGGITYAQ